MHTKVALDMGDVSLILAAACGEAEKNQWKVAIAVVDDGGHPLSLMRLDGCAPISSYIAIEKARTAALGQRETRGYEDMVNSGRIAFLSAPLLTSLEGGVPVIVDGEVIGAIGVSGVQPSQDAQIARAGVSSMASVAGS